MVGGEKIQFHKSRQRKKEKRKDQFSPPLPATSCRAREEERRENKGREVTAAVSRKGKWMLW